jgi:hypothetical protein
MWTHSGGGGGIGVRIIRFHRKNCSDLVNILHRFADLITADWSNILARIVDLVCNLVWILDCDFIVELLADSNLDKTIVGFCFKFGRIGGFVYPYSTPPTQRQHHKHTRFKYGGQVIPIPLEFNGLWVYPQGGSGLPGSGFKWLVHKHTPVPHSLPQLSYHYLFKEGVHL